MKDFQKRELHVQCIGCIYNWLHWDETGVVLYTLFGKVSESFMTPPQQQFGESGRRRIQNWVKAVVAIDNGLFKAHKFGRLTTIPLVKQLIYHSLHL